MNWISGIVAGLLTLCVACIAFAQPPNDACPGIAITSLPYTYDGNNTGSVTDYEWMCDDGPWLYGDVVFTLTIPQPIQVTASLCSGTSFNAQLVVFYGGECPGNNLAECSYNDCGVGYQRGTVTFNAAANTPYYILVAGGNAPGMGNYRLTVTGLLPPVNDACPGTDITSLPFSDSGSTAIAADDFNWSCVQSTPNSRDVIYHLALADCQEVTASLCGSSFDTQLIVRSQPPCPGSSFTACSDNACGQQSQVTFIAHGGWNYYLIVDGAGAASGNYILNVTGTVIPTLVNDVCPGTLITSLPFTDAGNTGCAGNDYPYTCSSTTSREVVYTLHLAQTGMVAASLCGSDFNTQLLVRSGGSCPGATPVICNDDFCGLQSQLTFLADAGTDYYLFVDGSGTGLPIGHFMLNVTMLTPQNDACPGFSITALPYVYSDDNTNCLQSYGYACAPANTAGNDVVFTLTLPVSKSVTASLCDSTDFDAELIVRTGGSCPGTTQVTCQSDNCGSGYHRGRVRFNAVAGVTYYLIVGGDDDLEPFGHYRLAVTETPANERCPGAEIPSLPYSVGGSTATATNDHIVSCSPTDQDTNDVVYRLLLSQCQLVTASLCGSSYDTRLAVFRSACEGTPVGCSDNYCGLQSAVTFIARSGTSYYLIVDGNGRIGDYALNVTGSPLPNRSGCPDTTITSLPFTETATLGCVPGSAAGLYDCWYENLHYYMIYNVNLPSATQVRVQLSPPTQWSRPRLLVASDLQLCSIPHEYWIACDSVLHTVEFQALAHTNYYVVVSDLSDVLSGFYGISITTDQPAAITDLVSRFSGANLELNWSTVANADSYYVYRGEVVGFPLDTAHRIAATASPPYLDSIAGNDPSPRHFYVVTAVNH